ncbi:phosphatase PAP2 family protein [Amycolatopsis sp. YIM 10]|uniref:phosphatase PAP2 family protein n=1 Tax=Amycolatopsis sp. YIM 10 TaxID=2653857 RepID=UPI0012AA901F|nr:phosphatase PAP2 family protein [Amycolatopsis sp. YIM 10]QFU86603.1 Putative undecaprenyl-diphosphatase YbjG [Amycolatopsis sp. YIM 10]
MSRELYDLVTGLAADSPWLVQALFEVGTNGAILALMALAAVLLWRARTDRLVVASVLLTAVATAVAYLLSELLKVLVAQDRPCRDSTVALETCPPVGDWSFPSNHTVIATTIAVGLLTLSRRHPGTAALALLLGAFAGFSRVFVGVHYPHDVLAGIALGTVVALAVVLPFRVLAAERVTRYSRSSR